MKRGKRQCRLESRMVQVGTIKTTSTDYMGVQLSRQSSRLLIYWSGVRIPVLLPYKNTFVAGSLPVRNKGSHDPSRFESYPSVFLYGNVAQWLMRHLHTVFIVGSSPTITTKFCKRQQVETRSKYSSKVLRRKKASGFESQPRGTAVVHSGTTLVETQVISIVLRGQARRPVGPE